MKKIWISLFVLSSIFTFQLIEIYAVEENNENVGKNSKVVELGEEERIDEVFIEVCSIKKGDL